MKSSGSVSPGLVDRSHSPEEAKVDLKLADELGDV